MKDFLKVLFPYILPYKIQALLNILFNILGSIFSLFSLAMLIPFLGILFETQELVTEKPIFEFTSDSILTNFYYLRPKKNCIFVF